MGPTPSTDFAQDLVLANDPHVVGPELLSLAVHRESSVRAVVAARQDCPVAALVSLGHDHRAEVLLAVLGNPRTPSSVVRNLADHRTPQISNAAEQRLRNTYR